MTFDLYGSVASTSSNAVNLLNLAMNYKSFAGSDYIVFNDSQYSYYVVWGDLEHTGNQVTGSDVEYIRYYRTDSTSYNGTYTYVYGEGSSFLLNLSDEYQTTSSLPEVGFVSLAAEQYQFYSGASDFFVFGLAILLVVMFCVLRGTNK